MKPIAEKGKKVDGTSTQRGQVLSKRKKKASKRRILSFPPQKVLILKKSSREKGRGKVTRKGLGYGKKERGKKCLANKRV